MNFLLDVDGVLTSGNFFYSIEGKVLKEFGPHDAYSLKKLKDKIKNLIYLLPIILKT